MNSKRKNIAVMGVGILATGSDNPGIPSMINVLKKLVENNSVKLYSFIPIDLAQVPQGLRVRSVIKGALPLKVKYLILLFQFLVDHTLEKFDVIHAQSPYPSGKMAIWINKLFKIPWILFLDGAETVSLPHIQYGDLLNPHLKKAAIDACRKAFCVVALTRYQSNLTQLSLSLSREIKVLPRGITVPDYKPRSIEYPIQFVHISNYHPIKDYETLLKVFSIVAIKIPCELTMVGKNDHPSVKHLLQVYNIEGKVKFIGTVQNDRLGEVFSRTHFLLQTSLYESMGMVVVEAIAQSVLVAGTPVGIMSDLQHCCLTSEVENPTNLANKIFEAINDQSLYLQLTAEAYAWVRNHDLKWFVKELENLYGKAMHTKELNLPN